MFPRGRRARLALLTLLLALAGCAAYGLGQYAVVRRHRQRALEALERRDFAAAAAELREALAIWPNDTSLRLLAVQAERRGGNLEAGWRELRLCEKLRAPAEQCAREGRLLAAARGDDPEVDALLEAYWGDPARPDAHLLLETAITEHLRLLERDHGAGMSILEGPAGKRRTRTERAIDEWSQTRPGSADQVQGCVWRGRVTQLLAPHDAAAQYARALAIDPDHFAARWHLATILADSEPAEAVGHVVRLRQRHPGNAGIRVYLAFLQRNLGQFAEARQLLDEVLAAHSDHLSALIERAKSALDAGDAADAEPFLRRALALAPGEPFIHLALSRSLYLAGNVQESKDHERRYQDLEGQRIRDAQVRTEAERAAWRQRLEREMLLPSEPRPSGSGGAKTVP
jgi:tetratricopeptide (TPR) repeat protein